MVHAHLYINMIKVMEFYHKKKNVQLFNKGRPSSKVPQGYYMYIKVMDLHVYQNKTL